MPLPDRILWFVAALLFGYTAIRAATVAFTFDEARSFILLKNRYLPDDTTSNTHYLNSLLMKVCSLLFGDSELSLRLPNVLAHLAFLVHGGLALSGIRSRWLALAGFITLQTNPYLLDFFSMGRGYGLALGFCMASVHYAVRRQPGEAGRPDTVRSFAAGVLSAVANLSFTTYLLGLIGGFVLARIASVGPLAWGTLARSAWRARHLALVVGIALVWLAFAGFDLKRRGELVWGGRDGFFTDTVEGLVSASFYSVDYGVLAVRATAVFLVGVVLVGAVGLAWRWYRARRDERDGVLLSLGALCLVGPIAQHHLLDTHYLAERTALLYAPVLGIGATFGWDALLAVGAPRIRRAGTALASVLAVLAVAHLVRTANLDRTFHFGFNARVDEVPARILQSLGGSATRVELGTQWTNGITLDYYVGRDHLDWLKINRVDKPFRYDLGLEGRFLVDRKPVPFAGLHWSHMSPGRFLLVHSPVAEQMLASPRHELEVIAHWPVARMYLLRVGPRGAAAVDARQRR